MATKRTGAAADPAQDRMERRIAEGLKKRRETLGLSANDLAERSGVSRAMVSKIERLEVSPTAVLLGRLCNGLGITLSSLIASAEEESGPPISRAATQPVWRDPETQLVRRMLSPINTGSRMELVHVELPAGAEVSYDALLPPQFDEHIYVLTGQLCLQCGAEQYVLEHGDCLRPRLDVPHTFRNPGPRPCKYIVVIAR